MSTQDDITSAIRRVDLMREHPPQGDLIFRAPTGIGSNEAREPWQKPLVDDGLPAPLVFASIEDLRQFVRAEVRKELDAIAQEFREHPALRPFPRVEDEG